MQFIENMSPITRGDIKVILADIDDTITENGYLPAKSYHAMEALSHAGIKFIPVTGRPAGWCDMIARLWPVSAVVGENGAFFLLTIMLKKVSFANMYRTKIPEKRIA